MGNSESKPSSQITELTEMPWRIINRQEQTIKEDIQNVKPEKRPNVILLGPAGAGKSSFINSCLSMGAGRKKASAQTGSADTSCTLKFRYYTDETLLKNFRLRDCIGVEPGYGKGFDPNDMDFLIKGHIKTGYKFDPQKPLAIDNQEYYNPNPEFEDKSHCVVFVVDAKVMYDGMSQNYVDKIKPLQTQIKEADISRVLVLTKCDKLCENVKENAGNIFRSVKVQRAVELASEVFGIEESSIHPVVNYEKQLELTTEQNIPILIAMCQILQYASDKVEQELHYIQ